MLQGCWKTEIAQYNQASDESFGHEIYEMFFLHPKFSPPCWKDGRQATVDDGVLARQSENYPRHAAD
jgi:hypothetical protein